MVSTLIMVVHYTIAALVTFVLATSNSTHAKWDIIHRSRLPQCVDRAHREKWLPRKAHPNVPRAKQELMKTRTSA